MRFRFRISTLVILITIFATIAAWYNSRREWKPRPFSESEVRDLLAQGRPVLVSVWAAWDLNSQYNEKFTVQSSTVRHTMRRGDWIFMRADWSDSNPEVERQQALIGLRSTPALILYCRDFDNPKVLLGVSSAERLAECMKQCSTKP